MKATFIPKSVFCSLAVILACVADCDAATIIASSQFNNPPYTPGITVGGQGASDSGWIAPWHKLGGFADRGHVVTSPTQEGNGAVQLFADQVFGTSIEREWFQIAPIVRVDGYVYVTPGASMQGQIVTATPASGAIVPRSAGAFKIEPSGAISVFDKAVDKFVGTGFHTLPYQWNKYSLIVNMNTTSYSFLFNDQPYNSPHKLALMNPMFYVDGINYSASETLTTYVDNVTVSVPEPSSVVLGVTGILVIGLATTRRKARASHDQLGNY